MKEMCKGFMCLLQVMIYEKKLGVAKQFHTVPDVTCEKTTISNNAVSVQIYMKKK